MAFLILPDRRAAQPQGPVEIDRGNPICKGMVDAFSGASLRSPVSGTVLQGTATIRAFKGGFSGEYGGSLHGANTAPQIDSTECTLLAIAQPSSTDTTVRSIFGYGNGGSINPLLLLGQGVANNLRFWARSDSSAGQLVDASSADWATGLSTVVVGTRSATRSSHKLYANGRAIASAAYSDVGAVTLNTTAVGGLRRTSDGIHFPGRVPLSLAWSRSLTDNEILEISSNPWQVYRPVQRRIYVDMGAGGGTAYSLEVTPASYSLIGNDAALIANQSLIVTPGSYETTGVSADLTYTSAAAGYELSVTPGSYALTGNDASLTATNVLGVTPGSYALTGSAADLSAARNLSVTPGAYTVTGAPVELTFTSSGFYVLDVTPGAYALSGADVALAYSAEVPAASMGFQLGSIREVTHKRLMDRILEARAQRIKPVAKRARKRARVIEVQAAEIAMTGNEAQFFGLMDDWLDQKPQLPPGIDAEEAFMAQVAMEVQRINEARRLFEQDEEDALMALLLA